MKKKTLVRTLTGVAVAAVAIGGIVIHANKNNKNIADEKDIADKNDITTDAVTSKTDEEVTNNESISDVYNISDTEESVSDIEKESSDNSIESEVNNEENTDKLSAEEEYIENSFYISEIPNEIFALMQGKSYKDNCTVPYEDLRYVHILHKDFEGNTKEGELVVNRLIAEDILEIFRELYNQSYPIEKVKLVDEYNADDEASMSDNNSSAFNFRFISYTTTISKHGLGLAIDINTLYNPYVKTVNGALNIEPANATEYVDRDKEFEHKIDHNDLCYRLFTEHGFEWGGDWNSAKDYQHFEVSDAVSEAYVNGLK
ncbi:MAG: M15 family metallopeptidase [Lachnospiraceae bacterium]|nr:M15 family metallopeptidase [Lachnospiraceae bacterium]